MRGDEAAFEAMSEAQYGEWLYQHRDDLRGEEVEVNVSPKASAVVSVRLSARELKLVEKAASDAEMPLSTYIRQAALATANTVNLDKARKDLTRLRTTVSHLERHLGAA